MNPLVPLFSKLSAADFAREQRASIAVNEDGEQAVIVDGTEYRWSSNGRLYLGWRKYVRPEDRNARPWIRHHNGPKSREEAVP